MAHDASVRTGLDVLIARNFDVVVGKRIGLLTNQSGVTHDLRDSVSLFAESSKVALTDLFAPEHGLDGAAQAGIAIDDVRDHRTGLPVRSLYGAGRGVLPECVAGLDVIVVDLQDAGLRYYTFAATLRSLLRAAATADAQVVVLDRPNPLGGTVVEGMPPYEKEYVSLVSTAPLAIRHGLTLGELARWLVVYDGNDVDLLVVPMSGWRRPMAFGETGLPWVPPSPNLPTPAAVRLYVATCMLEGTNISEGRGTTQPFETVGAPWLDGHELADRLNTAGLPGVRFRPTTFVPTFSKHVGDICYGVQAHVTDGRAFRGVLTGLTILRVLIDGWSSVEFLPPASRAHFDLLMGTAGVRESLLAGASAADLILGWEPALVRFERESREYWLYD